MALLAEEIDRAAAAFRPAGGLAGYHKWHNLLFVHWCVEPQDIEPLLPRGLSLDTCDGRAWVGLVPFAISGLRPWWFPPLPGVSAFNEINVRTYVHFRGRDPGVWFFSLDATSRLAARVARWQWRLNYFATRMRLRRIGDTVAYECCRAGSARKIGARIVAQVGPEIEMHSSVDAADDAYASSLPPGRTAPGTLEHFLLDRYILYAQQGEGPLYKAHVHHVPYQLRAARLLRCDQTLVAAAGIAVAGSPVHAAFCEHVDVEVFPLRRA